MNDERTMEQVAPWPKVLEELVLGTSYRPNWYLKLEDLDRGQGSKGLTLCIYTLGYDTYNIDKGQTYRVVHYFPVPPASYNYESWLAWVRDCLIDVETHEACEFFQVGGTRPFAPHHGPGWNPYIILHHGKDIDARTDFRGDVQETNV